jgi:hypothetical protein
MLFLFLVGKMLTISDAEFASYLLRAKQKLDNRDAQVDRLSQVVIAGDTGGKGTKRGRKSDTASTSNKIQKLGDDAVVEGGDDDGVQEKALPPPVKGGISSRQRSSGPVKSLAPQGEVAGSTAAEGEKSRTESPPIWNEDFDPLTFVLKT